ncbi:magnesium transporter [Alginatibacterium sediminis]|uniref:Magnesium transporter MgtE n=1 Tax=Alginatibacterium sediminis TaxID=2164068 RepID=A0A420E9B9_9ALTE|nr:magnesium transporter [Alginatibacterium sediminis]RKF15923.1 magnesium transporter [Alginatibacterium sediminis]
MADTHGSNSASPMFDQIDRALSQGLYVQVRRVLHQMLAADIALLLESSPPSTREILWQLSDANQHGEILDELNEEALASVLKMMDAEKLASTAQNMDVDDLAYVLRALPDSVYQDVLQQMQSQDRLRVEEALSYPEGSAGSIMNTDTTTIREDINVEVVLRYLRIKAELPEQTDTLYVVDAHDQLVGDVPLTTLLTVNPNLSVSEVMRSEVSTIVVDKPVQDIANLFGRHDWVSAPVVSAHGILLGRITIDDVVDIIQEQAEHRMMGMAGMDDDEDTFAPILTSTKRRTVWLAINLCAALIAASISNMFEATLAQIATLAVLMTIVPSMGGIAGNQTLALVIRALAVGHINDNNSKVLIAKEAGIGLLNGMLWASVVSGVVYFWKGDWTIAVILAVAMFINMAIGGLAGVCIPLLMKRFNIDPALAGGMALTTVTDVVGLFTFLGMATLVLA